MIAVDTNLLVYAHREDSPWHDAAFARIADLAESRSPWAIPWPCLHEFLAITTHPRIYAPPTPLSAALEQIEAWMEAPNLVLLSEADGYWPMLRDTISMARTTGAQAHDARIAALCRFHGIQELWTADRDFGRFPELTVRNPLVS
jgi:hypothetical protein